VDRIMTQDRNKWRSFVMTNRSSLSNKFRELLDFLRDPKLVKDSAAYS